MASVDVSVEVLNECQIQEVTLEGQEIIIQYVLLVIIYDICHFLPALWTNKAGT